MSGLIWIQTVWLFLKEFFEKVDFENNQQTTKKSMKNYPACNFGDKQVNLWLIWVLTFCCWERLHIRWLGLRSLWKSLCRLLITFANSFYPDQARQNVGPDLDPNWMTVFLKEFFEIVDFEKISRQQKKSMKNYPACKFRDNVINLWLLFQFGLLLMREIAQKMAWIEISEEITLLSVDNLCKQFGPRSGPTKNWAWSESKWYDCIGERIFRKSWFWKNQQTTKTHKKLPSMQT